MSSVKYLTLQQKLMVLFAATAVIILTVNLYLFSVMNEMAGKVEGVYISNVNLNELSTGLDLVQKSMEDYLNTRSSDAMKEYYRSEQAYQKLMGQLHTKPTDNDLLLTEKNICSLSDSYLVLTTEAIQAKREGMWKNMEHCMKRQVNYTRGYMLSFIV